MKTASRLAASLTMLLLFGWYNTEVHAAEFCHTATSTSLINWYGAAHPDKPLHYDPYASAIYHPVATLRTTSPPQTWIGLAWLSPVWGALFVTDCDGKPLAAISEGAIGKLSTGPVVSGLGQTAMVEYVDHETADCVHDSINIVALKDGKILSLWRHESKQGMNIAAAQSAFRGFVTRNYTVTFTGDAQTLHVTGQLNAYPYLKDGSQSATPAANETLPAESYRWDARKLRFLPQAHYRRFKPCVRTAWPSVK